MALILNLETATTVCSVALGRNGELAAYKEVNKDYSHSENLTVFIQAVLKEAKLDISDLDAVAVSKGPGSYTGLRIGVSAAKGLCFALDKPLIAINTLQAMAYSEKFAIQHSPLTTLFCPMIDARRMEVYCAFYNSENKEIRKTTAEIIDENSFAGILKKHKVVFFGDGASKCKSKLAHYPNAVFIDNIFPSAKNMIKISQDAFNASRFEDMAYFEPYYLKDFVTGAKKINT